MDLVIQAKQRRLQKMHRTKELHGWIVHDPWIQNKVYKNLVSGEYKEVSYVTKDYYNPLPFHMNIEYVGIVHDDKIQYNDTIQKKFITNQNILLYYSILPVKNKEGNVERAIIILKENTPPFVQKENTVE